VWPRLASLLLAWADAAARARPRGPPPPRRRRSLQIRRRIGRIWGLRGGCCIFRVGRRPCRAATVVAIEGRQRHDVGSTAAPWLAASVLLRAAGVRQLRAGVLRLRVGVLRTPWPRRLQVRPLGASGAGLRAGGRRAGARPGVRHASRCPPLCFSATAWRHCGGGARGWLELRAAPWWFFGRHRGSPGGGVAEVADLASRWSMCGWRAWCGRAKVLAG
jgi:hypothetical protein